MLKTKWSMTFPQDFEPLFGPGELELPWQMHWFSDPGSAGVSVLHSLTLSTRHNK